MRAEKVVEPITSKIRAKITSTLFRRTDEHQANTVAVTRLQDNWISMEESQSLRGARSLGDSQIMPFSSFSKGGEKCCTCWKLIHLTRQQFQRQIKSSRFIIG